MSRRKQPNPKPAKREPSDFDQVVPELNLPSSHLYLREFGGESLVLAKQRLRAGTVLGTYKGHLQDPDKEDGKSILKVNRSDGGCPVHVMLEDEGHWLKLMRTANLPTEANICLRISGGDIVCTVTKDVNKEVELKVIYRIADQEEKAKEFFHFELPSRPLKEICESDSIKNNLNEPETDEKGCMKSEKMLDFVSEAITNSRENMSSKHYSRGCDRDQDGRRTRMENNEDSDCEVKDPKHEVSSSTSHRPPSSDEKAAERTHVQSSSGSSSRERIKSSEVEVAPKTRQLGEEERIYRCPPCNFLSADQYAYDKHIQSHRQLLVKKASSKMTNSKSYCEPCKIQFMSIDTYHVHKQLYCKSRKEKEDSSTSPSLPDSNPGPAFKPGPETVIIRSGVNGGVTSSLIQPQAIYAAISTNPLILLPCSLVNGQGLVPQRGVIPTGAPGIVLQTGIACPTIVEKPSAVIKEENPPSRKTSHPIMNFSSDSSDRTLSASSSLRKRKMSEGDVLNLKKACPSSESIQAMDSDSERKDSELITVDQDAPLDLSVKNKFINMASRPPSKRKNSIASGGSPSPSLPNTSDSGSPPRPPIPHSRVTISPSSPYSGDSIHCYSSQVPVVLPRMSHAISERLSPMPPVLQADASGDKAVIPPGLPPPKLLKQGNNICEECHIVFYKYDNYLAHKKHYCAFRRRQLSAIAAAAASSQDQSSDDNNSNHSGINESSTSYQSDEAGKAVVRRNDHAAEQFRPAVAKSSHSVFCCDWCGVKFSTSDNLHAHQTYYCKRKADSAMSKAACARGENAESPKALESPFSGPEEWKCNYCDATCASYDTIRRHLLTHSELRGFRCIVCGYKGNTLRGMRSHACEHLGESSTSIEEFVSNNVIAENGVMPILLQSMDRSDDDSDHSRDNKTVVRREKAYRERSRERSSSFKRDVLSTDHSESNELSSSPRTVENASRESVPNRISPIKMESGDSSPEASGSSHQETVNPLAFCDVVIKTEIDQSSGGEDSSREEQHSFIKYEPEPEYDSDDRPRDMSKSPPGQSTSVIRRASDLDKPEDRHSPIVPSKRKSRPQSKLNSDMKYCKSCDISFSHLSNFLAHKKYYCISRVMQNCHQEATTVQ